MNDFENAIEINGVTKRYDGFTLDNMSFTVPKGSIMGFIGQNGAGKTTTIKILLNIIKADEGSVNLLGMDHIKNEYEIKERLSAVFDVLPFPEVLTAQQLNIVLSGIFSQWDSREYFDYLERFGLPVKKKLKDFSKGMKMKLQIAAALSHKAKLLIMDEATTGLDPVVRNEILDIFREYVESGENSILMSSHITSDIEKIADSVTFIDKGKLLLTGYKDDIIDSHGILRCATSDYKSIADEDIISIRKNDFGADILVHNREECRRKYSGAVIDKASLEEIMLFYVNRNKKEWN